VRDVVQILEDDEDAANRERSQPLDLPKKRHGAQKGPGAVAAVALGVEITDEQYA